MNSKFFFIFPVLIIVFAYSASADQGTADSGAFFMDMVTSVVISCPTHPDQNLWYNNNDPSFSWTTPYLTPTGFYYIIDNSPSTAPTGTSGKYTRNTNLTVADLADGTWYFHIVPELSPGELETTADHYRINIDTIPELSIREPAPYKIFPSGTTSTTLSVSITNHSGSWSWRLNTPFPASGSAGGSRIASGNTATITGLKDGQAYTIYAALVDNNGNLLTPSVTASAAFSVALPSNRPPTANPQSVTTDEDTPVTIKLTGSDPDGNVLTFKIASQPKNGTLSGTSPDMKYTPNKDFNGNDSFTFITNDGTVDSQPAVINIIIKPVNDQPISNPQVITTNEDIPAVIKLAGIDPDGDKLTFKITTQPKNGILSGTPPDVTYTPKLNFNGTDSFTFVTNDGTIDSQSGVINITIKPVNDQPISNPQVITTNEDTPVAIKLAGSDADGDKLTFRIITQPENGELIGIIPDLTYKPKFNFNGADSFAFIASDNIIDSQSAIISIIVKPVNDSPTASSTSVSTDEDKPVLIKLNGDDPDLDKLEFKVINQPANGALDGTPPELIYRPKPDFNGDDSFTFVVSDGAVDSDPAKVNIKVNPVNDPPAANSQVISTDEDKSIVIKLSGSDIESSKLTFKIIDQPKNGTLSGTIPDLTYIPKPNFNGDDGFTFVVNDSVLDSQPVTVSITVKPVNDPPIAKLQAVSTDEDRYITIRLSGDDPDGDKLIFKIIDQPKNGALGGTAPNLTYTPKQDYNGTDSFTFIVNDGIADSSAEIISITVKSINDPPVAAPQTVITDEDKPVGIKLSASDPDGDKIALKITVQPKNGELSGIVPDLTYTPKYNFNGTDSFTFMANDSIIDSQSAIISIIVKPVNDPPTASSMSVSTDEGKSVGIKLIGNDLDGDKLTFKIVDQPKNGALSGTAPDLIYTSKQEYNGIDGFTFIVSDGVIETQPAEVEVSIHRVNKAPIAISQTINTNEDTPVTIQLMGDDPDGDKLTFKISAQPRNGTLGGTPPEVIYIPKKDFSGTDNFTFITNDGYADSKSAKVTITIKSENDPPTATPQTVQTDEDNPVTIKLTAADPDSKELALIIVSQPKSGTLSGSVPDLTYTPKPNFYGTDSFEFKARDEILYSSPATVVIKVKPIDDPPVASSQKILTEEDNTISIKLSGVDPDGDRLIFTITEQPGNGLLAGISSDWTYAPNQNFYGEDSFTFTVKDGNSESRPATVSITVKSINDPPVTDSQTLTTKEGVSIAIILTGYDPDGDAITYRITDTPRNGSLLGDPPEMTYKPFSGFKGIDSFTYVASDKKDDSQPTTFNIVVGDVTEPSIPLLKYETILNINLEPKEVPFNDKVKLLGGLSILQKYGNIAPGVQKIQIIFTSPSKKIKTFEVKTDTEGNYRLEYPFSLDELGTWNVRAQFDGSNQLSPVIRDSSFTVVKGQADIIFSTGSTFKLGTEIELLGYLKPQLTGELISLKIVDPKKISKQLSVNTETSGKFSYKFKLDKVGDWEITAAWSGNDQYNSVSKIFIIHVPEQSGKAIIVLGPSNDNEDRDITNKLAQYVHNIFERRGFDREKDIYFLSPEPVKTEGADHETSMTGLEFAITKWAEVNQQTPLYIYLLSHNMGDQFLLERHGNSQVYLTPADLNSFLGKLTKGTQVIIIIEACYSGSFIRSNDGKKTALVASDRIIITSARNDQLSNIGNNLYSFSKAFFDEISRNKTIADSFREAEKFMPYITFLKDQIPQMDADGDANVNTQLDYDAVKDHYIPVNFVSMASLPEIIGITESKTLQKGVISSEISVFAIGTNIKRVFATIIPPNYDKPYFPQIELNKATGKDNVYSGVYANFTIPGDYTIIIDAENPDGYADPVLINITVPSASATTKGDVNSDGKVNSKDALLVSQFAAGIKVPIDEQKQSADMNDDGKVDSRDTILILRKSAESAAPGMDVAHNALYQNYPNPFNPETWIPYRLMSGGDVTIRIYKISGEMVRELKLGYKPAGIYTDRDRSAYWDGRDGSGTPVASGVYFYGIHAGDFYAVRKLIIAR